jgi:hypothetical protein
LKLKITNCYANIHFNRQCLAKGAVPNYANKIKSPTPPTTLKEAQILRINDEIKFLYKKKQHLNTELYKAHLKTAQEWNITWNLISNYVHIAVNLEATKKYTTIHTKLDKLSKQQQPKHPINNTQFYPRVVNNTNIAFSSNELSLLNKVLKYNLHYKHKNWLHTLALEAETAITHLHIQQQDGIRHLIATQMQRLSRQLNNSGLVTPN